MADDVDDEALPARDGVEAVVRTHLGAGELDAAATRALERYGPELFGFLRALARDDDLAAEAFAAASEHIWRGLPRFRWEASLRTWCYQLARNALHQARIDPRRRPERNLPMSLLQSVVEVQRSATAPYQRTDIKDGLRALRESLTSEDHEIMILRLDRGMSWKDIARSIDGEDLTGGKLDQRAASLRKRFERAKSQLRDMAIAAGLLPTPSDDTT
ncbi:MAG: sigma-70 family RNA polymerase sigma factor [Deltaproteobacteria bacterium]|nr:sigma-70 family RNA polymerase sigma factor [Deltaproteobacteria bacterium]MCW5809182.1 sigma-70 family RNA polymerase sigma factor [Deltaproteobacteria bacterium]